jgi:hypothetical protein
MQLRYANNSNYKSDNMITREVFVSQAVLDEVKRIVEASEVSGIERSAHTIQHGMLDCSMRHFVPFNHHIPATLLQPLLDC